MPHPRAVIVCEGLVLDDERGEEAEQEGPHQFTAHHLAFHLNSNICLFLFCVVCLLSFVFFHFFFCLLSFLSSVFCLFVLPPAASVDYAMEDDRHHWRGPEGNYQVSKLQG